MDWCVCTTAETDNANCAHWRQWQEFYLWRKGVQLQKGLQLVPQTSNLISTLPEAASMVKWHTLTVAETVFRQLHTHRWIQLCLSYWPLQLARVLSIMCYRWLGRSQFLSWIQALRSVRILAQRMPGFGCISGLTCPKGRGSRLDHELKGILNFVYFQLAVGLKVARWQLGWRSLHCIWWCISALRLAQWHSSSGCTYCWCESHSIINVLRIFVMDI